MSFGLPTVRQSFGGQWAHVCLGGVSRRDGTYSTRLMGACAVRCGAVRCGAVPCGAVRGGSPYLGGPRVALGWLLG